MIRDKDRKIAIVTFTYGDNLGQRLQNYAVQEVLKKYAHYVCTLRQNVPVSYKKMQLKQMIKRFFDGSLKDWIKRHKSFVRFDKDNICYHKGKISSKLNKKFDFFVAGSDQIWSPYSGDVNDTMFLTFAEKKKRICFSPSIAAEEIPEDKKEKYKEYFNGFYRISVREHRGEQIVRELTNHDAITLIDPTLMLGAKDWEKIEKKPDQELESKYALVYFLGDESYMEEIQDICNRNNLQIVNILKDKLFKSIGPSEFLFLMRNANLVFTDSYHGTIFSIIFRIPFVICERKGTKLNMNSRFETLFEKVKIENRRFGMVSQENLFEVDFSYIHKQLEKERADVDSFLKECIFKQEEITSD